MPALTRVPTAVPAHMVTGFTTLRNTSYHLRDKASFDLGAEKSEVVVFSANDTGVLCRHVARTTLCMKYLAPTGPTVGAVLLQCMGLAAPQPKHVCNSCTGLCNSCTWWCTICTDLAARSIPQCNSCTELCNCCTGFSHAGVAYQRSANDGRRWAAVCAPRSSGSGTARSVYREGGCAMPGKKIGRCCLIHGKATPDVCAVTKQHRTPLAPAALVHALLRATASVLAGVVVGLMGGEAPVVACGGQPTDPRVNVIRSTARFTAWPWSMDDRTACPYPMPTRSCPGSTPWAVDGTAGCSSCSAGCGPHRSLLREDGRARAAEEKGEIPLVGGTPAPNVCGMFKQHSTPPAPAALVCTPMRAPAYGLMSAAPLVLYNMITPPYDLITRSHNTITPLCDMITRSCNTITTLYDLITRSCNMITPLYDLITRSRNMITPLCDMITRSYNMISPQYDLITRSRDVIVRSWNVLGLRRLHVARVRPDPGDATPRYAPAFQQRTRTGHNRGPPREARARGPPRQRVRPVDRGQQVRSITQPFVFTAGSPGSFRVTEPTQKVMPAIRETTRLTPSELANKADHIVEQMTGNPAYPSPQPSLASITTASAALRAAITAAMGGGRMETAVRNARRTELKNLLDRLADHVSSVAGNNEEVVLSSGFGFRKPGTPKANRARPATSRPASASTWVAWTSPGRPWPRRSPTTSCTTRAIRWRWTAGSWWA